MGRVIELRPERKPCCADCVIEQGLIDAKHVMSPLEYQRIAEQIGHIERTFIDLRGRIEFRHRQMEPDR